MALTLNNFVGVETGGLEEFIATTGAPVADEAAKHTGDYSVKLPMGDTVNVDAFAGGSAAGNGYVLGFWFKPAGFPTTLNNDTWVALSSGSPHWRVGFQLGTMYLYDAVAAEVTNVAHGISANEEVFVEIYWEDSDAGAFILYIDGVEKFNEAGVDLRPAALVFSPGEDSCYRFRAFWGTGGTLCNIDDTYCYSGAAGVGDFLGDAEVFRYQADTASATPDVGDNLDYGSADIEWDEVGTTPGDADEIGYEADAVLDGDIYTDDAPAGKHFRHGPDGDANIDGTIIGGKWLHQLKRGNGGGTNHYKRYGNDGDGGARGAVSLTTAYQNFITVSEAAASVPLSTEHFSLGFGRDGGGRELYCKGMWAFILHVPSVGPSPGELESAARQRGALQPQFLPPEVVAY